MCYVPPGELSGAQAAALVFMFIGAFCFLVALICVYNWWQRKVAAFEQAVNDKIIGTVTDGLGVTGGE